MKKIALLFTIIGLALIMSVQATKINAVIADSQNESFPFNSILTQTKQAKSPVINWGLTPNTREETPGIPEWSGKMLADNNGIYIGSTAEKKVYLTFDLGYEAGFTHKVLDILKEHNIKGIFFLCGHYVEKENELIERMIAEGHAIGNHTDKHKDLPKLDSAGIQKDIMTLQENYQAKYPKAEPMKFFRPPFGRFDEKTLKIANENKLKTVLWSTAIVDWGKEPIDAKAGADKITKRIHPGAIILSHITNAGTPEMLKLLIPQLQEKGYQFGNPSEL